MKATGGDSVGNVSIGGTVYYRHVFTKHVNATLNDSGAALTAGSNVVGGVTVTDGMVVYVEDSSDPEQIGNTYQATGATDNWSWSLYGLTIYSSFTAQLLLVAGGGAGAGDDDAGPPGGGAGEVAWIDRSLSPGFLPARIGKGGIGPWRLGGSSGNNTIFGDAVAVGGGGVTRFSNGLSGGSGGGGASFYTLKAGTGGASVASLGFGNAGGASSAASSVVERAGGGGGGAGASGSDATLGVGGSGGAGIDMSANVGTDVGVNGWFGGGGGGASYRNMYVNGTGGAGGGGAAINSVAKNGIANTGGGGGAYGNSVKIAGGNGGSGIIIVRYLSSSIVAQLRRAHAENRGMRA